ncbi:MAG: thioredoxin domain-containing protein, partial [Myxococcota bacterium]
QMGCMHSCCKQKSAPLSKALAPASSKRSEKRSTQNQTSSTGLDALQIDSLTHQQKTDLVQLLSNEICPCGQPTSMLGCLQKKPLCKPALELGQWVADVLQQGAQPQRIARLISQEVAAFLNKPKRINTVGYAYMGAANPQVVLVEYANFQCGHCKEASKIARQLVEKYPQQVRLIFKHMPFGPKPQKGQEPHNNTMSWEAAYAVEAASTQNAFWPMHDLLFARQNRLFTYSQAPLAQLAKELGLDMTQWTQQRNSQSVQQRVQNSREEAEKLGIQGTPTFFFNHRPYHLPVSLQTFELRTRMELARPTTPKT